MQNPKVFWAGIFFLALAAIFGARAMGEQRFRAGAHRAQARVVWTDMRFVGGEAEVELTGQDAGLGAQRLTDLLFFASAPGSTIEVWVNPAAGDNPVRLGGVHGSGLNLLMLGLSLGMGVLGSYAGFRSPRLEPGDEAYPDGSATHRW